MEAFDLAVCGGLVADGSGAEPALKNVYVRGNKIALITDEAGLPAARTVNAAGCVVAPGFVDIHTHSDTVAFGASGFEAYVHQGVTTCLGGNCGGSPIPRSPLNKDGNPQWWNNSGYTAALNGISANNVGTFVGHGTLRNRCMADPRRTLPTAEELEKMKQMLAEQLADGAFGLSCGLEYVPGLYCETGELIELAKVVARYGRMMPFHMRNEDVRVEEAVEEVLRIGRESGAHVHISHLKVEYSDVPCRLDRILRRVEEARAAGMNVTMDVYPYAACSTSFSPQLPEDMRISTAEAVKLYRDDASFEELRPYVEHFFARRQGPEKIGIAYTGGKYPELEGLTFDRAAQKLGMSVTDAYRKIMTDCSFRVTAIYYAMQQEDVLTLLRRPDVSVVSDSTSQDFVSSGVRGVPHPRTFNSFARFLRLNREEHLLPIGEAVRKITSLPAETAGIANRGRLLPGYFADITVFDPAAVRDNGTYTEPGRLADGFVCTVLNGRPVYLDGAFTGERSGMGLSAVSE